MTQNFRVQQVVHENDTAFLCNDFLHRTLNHIEATNFIFTLGTWQN